MVLGVKGLWIGLHMQSHMHMQSMMPIVEAMTWRQN